MKNPHPNEIIEKESASRTWFVVSCVTFLFVALLVQASLLIIKEKDFLNNQAQKRSLKTAELEAPRGTIYDSKGVPLALSEPSKALWIDVPNFKATSGLQSKLLSELKVEESYFNKKMKSHKFFLLSKKVDSERYKKIKELKIKGLIFHDDYIRRYPLDNLFSQSIGFLNFEGVGSEGLEKSMDSRLSGTNGTAQYIRDGKGNLIAYKNSLQKPIPGEDIHLTMDSNIQFFVRKALSKALSENNANFAAAVVLSVKTGEVLASLSLPDFNPNDSVTDFSFIQNKAVSYTFEPGSTLKPFIMAKGLDTNAINTNYQVNTEVPVVIGKHVLKDQHPKGVASLPVLIQKSSNIASIKVAQTLGADKVQETYSKLGFGKKPGAGFYYESSYHLESADKWSEIELATRSYGHGIAVSLLQLAKAYFSLARDDGAIPNLKIIKNREELITSPVFKSKTVKEMRTMLKGVVSPDGTANAAVSSFYDSAGKTGTSKKIKDGKYVKEYISYFTGFAPADNPEIIVAVMVDEPKNGKYYGGAVAGPVYKEIMENTLKYLGSEDFKGM